MRAAIVVGLLATSLAANATSKPERIVSLSPHVTELVFAAGLGDKLVGVSAHSDYPAKAQQIEQISDYQSVNIERIVALNTDLVIAWPSGISAAQLDKLKAFNIPIFYSNPTNLAEIADTIEALGQFSDTPEIAKAAANKLREAIATLANQYQHKAPVRYFYTFSTAPLMSNNGEAWPQALFSLCGGVNIVADSEAPYPIVNMEQIVIAKPEVVFYSSRVGKALDWQAWHKVIPAVKNQAVIKLTSDSLGRPTPRAIAAAEEICQHLDKMRS